LYGGTEPDTRKCRLLVRRAAGECEMRAKKMWRKYGVLFHVLMPLELAEKIYELSEKMDITYSDIIRQALKEYFEKLEDQESEHARDS